MIGRIRPSLDANSSHTETVTPNSATVNNGYCSISLSSPSYTHASYTLQSGTCGVREALNDLQGNGGEVIVDQGFYDAGCTQSTITGLSITGPLLANSVCA